MKSLAVTFHFPARSLLVMVADSHGSYFCFLKKKKKKAMAYAITKRTVINSLIVKYAMIYIVNTS